MKDLNAGFLLDIWADLKAKRLAPVAIGLVVALVAMPVLMMRGGGSTDDVPLPLPVAAPASEGGEVVVDDETASVSKLDSYEERDPFKGMKTDSGESKVENGVTGAATSPLDEAAKEGGSTGVTSGSTGGGSSDGSTTTSPGGSEDTGTGTGTTPTVPPGVTPPVVKRKYFNFRLDIEFGKPGREKRYPSLSRLSFLQGGEVPIALYLGVNEEQDTAMFLVYPGLNHQGEGQCLPKPTNCNFLALKVGREHYFSANDREYRIELHGIKRVQVDEEKKARSVARKAAARRAARGSEGGTTGDDAGVEPYDWPLLVDAGG